MAAPAFALLLALSPLQAATMQGATTPLPRFQPMQVRLVQDDRPGCAPTCGRWIAMEGKIEPGTATVFERVLKALGSRRLPIFIDSGGGSVPDAMAIGRRVRAHHLDVVVTATRFDDCAATPSCTLDRGVRGGRPEAAGALCASACVLVLAAGQRRGAAPWTGVGVHRMVNHETLVLKRRFFRIWTRMVDGVRVEVDRQLVGERQVAVQHRTVAASQPTYDKVGAYLDRMGERSSLLSLMEATPAESLHLLSREEETSTAIVTDTADGDFMLAEAARMSAAGSGARMAAAERAFLVLPAAGKAVIAPARVDWHIERSPPSREGAAQPAVLKADVELAGAKRVFSLEIKPDAAASKGPLQALIGFALPERASQPVTRVLPLARRAFASLTRIDLTGPAKPLPANLFRAVLTDGIDLAAPLPSGEPSWISARGVTNGFQIPEILFEPPPRSMLDEATKAWTTVEAVAPVPAMPKPAVGRP